MILSNKKVTTTKPSSARRATTTVPTTRRNVMSSMKNGHNLTIHHNRHKFLFLPLCSLLGVLILSLPTGTYVGAVPDTPVATALDVDTDATTATATTTNRLLQSDTAAEQDEGEATASAENTVENETSALTAATNSLSKFATLLSRNFDVDPYCDPLKHDYCFAPDSRGGLDVSMIPRDFSSSTATQEQINDLIQQIVSKAQANRVIVVNTAVAAQIVKNWDTQFRTANLFGFAPIGVGRQIDINVLSVGVIIDNIADVDYLEEFFTVDLKVYISNVTYGYPYENMVDASNKTTESLLDSYVASYREEGLSFKMVLGDEFRDKFGESINNAPMIPTRDGRCTPDVFYGGEALLTEEAYKQLGGLMLKDSASALTPVLDREGRVVYLRGKNAKVEFRTVNSKFFPFQQSLLDIVLMIPPSESFLEPTRVQNVFCVQMSRTGFRTPLRSVKQDDGKIGTGNGDFLQLIPYLSHSRAEPWFNSHDPQLSYGSPGKEEARKGNRIIRTVTFRLMWDQPSVNSWMYLFPFLFTAFTTQMQWLAITPDRCTASVMITAVLIIQNVVNAQKPLVGRDNIAVKVIYLTYGITAVYISAVATMTFINIAREQGKYLRLVQYQGSIFRYTRLFGLLLTPLFVPLLVLYRNPDSGYQQTLEWLWYLTGCACIFIWLAVIAYDCYWNRRWRKETQVTEDHDFDEAKSLNFKNVHDWSIEEVGIWISSSTHMLTYSHFTEWELEAIADKFRNAKIDGEALLKVWQDAKLLVQFVDLAIGEALHFTSTIEKIMSKNILNLEGASADTESGKDDSFSEERMKYASLRQEETLAHI